jgi:hypothetical protein
LLHIGVSSVLRLRDRSRLLGREEPCY